MKCGKMQWDDWIVVIGILSWCLGGVAFCVRHCVKLMRMFL